MTYDYILTCLVVVLLPGSGVLYTMAVGLGRGFRASIAAAFGCTLGIVPAATASIVGLAAILHTSALAFQVIKYLGVAYLFYMAWNILRDGGLLAVKEDKRPVSYGRIAINGTLLNILNPKLSLFFLAFLPQFIPVNSEHVTFTLFYLAAFFMALTFVIFVGYGAFASLARDHLTSRPSAMSWLRRSFAATFGLLGMKLALGDR
ncbi:LysE family translocator [Ahrensia sp. AH-315-G08]|nr:LysE family translocator [Ahrensia sp. AH-315-G08]